MYAVKRSDGLFLCDGPVYARNTLPQPIWQTIDGTRNLYSDESIRIVERRLKKLKKIYIEHVLTLYKLSEEELAHLSFKKLRGY